MATAIARLPSQPQGCLWVSPGREAVSVDFPHLSQIQGYVTASQLLAVIAQPSQGNPLERQLGEIAQPSPALPVQGTTSVPELGTAVRALAESNALRFLLVDDQQQVLGQLSREALQQGVIDQLLSLAPIPQGIAPATEPAQHNPIQAQTLAPAGQVVQAPLAGQLSPTVQPALQTALDQLSQALKALEVHGQAESKLQHRIAFEALLTQISTQFLNLREGEIAPALHGALARTATFTDCDRACIFLYSQDGSEAHCHHEWNRDNLIPFTKPLRSILRHTFPWSLAQMQQQQAIHVPDVEALPREATPERQAAQQLQAQSYVVLPIHFQGQPLGWLAFYAVDQPKTWAPADLKQLQTLSSIIAGVIARQQAETALVKSEAALAYSEAKFSQAFRLNPIPMCITVMNGGDYVEVNDAFCEYLGFSREELIGQTVWELDMIADPNQCAAIHESLASRGSFQNIELHIRDRQGRVRIAQSSGICLDVAGQERFLTICRDITEQRQQETQRQQIEQALRQASQAAKAANQAKGALLAMVSHEIRTPLNAILTLSNLLLEGELSPQQREQVELLHQGGSDLLAIVDDVLDFSRQEAIADQQLSLDITAFELTDCIHEVLELFSPQAQAQGLTLQAELSPLVETTLVSDRQRLKQILTNLLNNAIKFTPTGQITLSVSPWAIPESDLLFSVRDPGIGISQAGLDRLFEPFSQADASIAGRYGGTGLGLSICDRIVRRLGGNIWVESGGNIGGNPPEGWAMRQVKPDPHSAETDPGSHFYFNLPQILSPDPGPRNPPLASQAFSAPASVSPVNVPSVNVPPVNAPASSPASAPAQKTSPAPLPELPPASIKMLLLDDIELNQRVAQLILQSLGYEVDIFSNGAAAIAALQQQPYDLLFLDLHLPQLDGYGIYQQVQALPHRPWVIVISAAVDPASRDRCHSLGMNDFVPKPISREALTQALSRFWLQRQVQSAQAQSTQTQSAQTQSAQTQSAPTQSATVQSPQSSAFPLFASQAPSLQLETFDEVRQLCGLDGYFQELLLTYQKDAALQLQAMARAQVEQDGLALFEVVHSLGPASASLGGARLAELCAHLEGQLRNHGFHPLEPGQSGTESPVNWTAIAAHLKEIATEYHRLVAAMEFQAWEL